MGIAQSPATEADARHLVCKILGCNGGGGDAEAIDVRCRQKDPGRRLDVRTDDELFGFPEGDNRGFDEALDIVAG